jgi:hypothetical protein
MTLSEFRLAVRAYVADRLPHDALIMIAEDGATYRRGALTVHVGEQHGAAIPTAFGRYRAYFQQTASRLSDGADVVIAANVNDSVNASEGPFFTGFGFG